MDARITCLAQDLHSEILMKKKKSEVLLGNDRKIEVKGEGTITIETMQGNTKVLHDVQFVPSLAYNLMSVG